MATFGFAEVFILLAVGLTLALAGGTVKRLQRRPMPPGPGGTSSGGAIMIGLGALVFVVESILIGSDLAFLPIAGGALFAWTTYLVMRATRSWLSARTVVVYFLGAYLLLGPWMDTLLGWHNGWGGIVPAYWFSPTSYWNRLLALPRLVPVALEIGLITGAAYFLVTRGGVTRSPTPGSTTYGGAPMGGDNTEATRLAAASAVTGGITYRTSVIERARGKYRAVGAELGLDAELVLRVCVKMERRETAYQLGFTAMLILALAGWAVQNGVVLFVALVGMITLQLLKTGEERFRFLPMFARGRFDVEAVRRWCPELEADLAAGVPRRDQNVVVYQGFAPFAGAGFDWGGWSFALDVTRPKEHLGTSLPPQAFEVAELYDAVEGGIASLGLDQLDRRDCLFVHGTDVAHDPRLLPDRFSRPVQRVDAATFAALAAGPGPVRRYKWLRLYKWGGDIVVSFFFRCSLQGNNMFVEVSRFLLPPLESRYRAVDRLPPPSFRNNAAWAIGNAIVSPFAAAVGAIVLVATALRAVAQLLEFEDRRLRRLIRDDPLFNYGAAAPLRESVGTTHFLHYFQKIDWEMYQKTMDRQLLDTIVDFLDSRNIDVSDVKERGATILNSGIIVQGGDVTAQNLAVGQRARAGVVGRLAQRVRGQRTPQPAGR